jgi:Na+/proline symporter
MSQLPVIDIGVVVVYLAAMVGIELWFGRHGQNTEKFMAVQNR